MGEGLQYFFELTFTIFAWTPETKKQKEKKEKKQGKVKLVQGGEKMSPILWYLQ